MNTAREAELESAHASLTTQSGLVGWTQSNVFKL